ncbi:2'-5' RNA ligase [candidate division WWE3 bacterium RIFCSPHIGHO2_12_FULL_38_15]|uniref:2'-5' RNA ligase n=1 Tax=candidate division WWE3 bacterium RIFCSPHIGHO2_02_FULL_38_14 TaxID=1802620 RepID=A0A1F4V975_UNCKA|nr:MAG: 2'-5' RNA ligase [candidate division WWE3 bacterium RIFCSPHIGHO2_01_FULL_38_45]OGC48344.1 MAG: 2'-5' RNA ligase [candidate division WWE3 bacterium RIFCSPHIGHO2_12_FULL_38_15]OGC53678.1 MAG: 2'-5' RNA ligase [candidate division WWE3 bacterium RIFCSPHIGHO2_02_FULL_38_14]OGC54279.1 MAG: 2'-5' RNA ligase [candidate division WWE3 bacterium RIFCSPLOWO2_01_FULL_37_24]HLB51522.1 RNA 2',3'-cyclic phosphodiesterase [Patescibacteria group bacterium]
MYRNAFVGVLLPNNIAKKYISLLKKLKGSGNISDVELESLENDIPHITLYFLGDQSEEGINKINKTLSDLDLILKNIKIEIDGLGMFKKQNDSVAYLKVRKTKELSGLYTSLEKNLKNIYFERRPFVPHLTLSRKFNVNNSELLQKLKSESENIKWVFNTTTLNLFGRESKSEKMKILAKIQLI